MAHFPRRLFLKQTLATAVLVGAGTALFRSGWALAAEWSKAGFESTKLDEAMAGLFGKAPLTPSPAVKLKVPAQAENSAQVQVQVETDLPNVEAIAVFVEKNPRPLIVHATYTGADTYLSARMKMAQTSDVHAVIKAGGKLYTAKQNVKVTAGGC